MKAICKLLTGVDLATDSLAVWLAVLVMKHALKGPTVCYKCSNYFDNKMCYWYMFSRLFVSKCNYMYTIRQLRPSLFFAGTVWLKMEWPCLPVRNLPMN